MKKKLIPRICGKEEQEPLPADYCDYTDYESEELVSLRY